METCKIIPFPIEKISNELSEEDLMNLVVAVMRLFEKSKTKNEAGISQESGCPARDNPPACGGEEKVQSDQNS